MTTAAEPGYSGAKWRELQAATSHVALRWSLRAGLYSRRLQAVITQAATVAATLQGVKDHGELLVDKSIFTSTFYLGWTSTYTGAMVKAPIFWVNSKHQPNFFSNNFPKEFFLKWDFHQNEKLQTLKSLPCLLRHEQSVTKRVKPLKGHIVKQLRVKKGGHRSSCM